VESEESSNSATSSELELEFNISFIGTDLKGRADGKNLLGLVLWDLST